MAKAMEHLWNLSQDEILREYLEAIDKKERDRISRENFVNEEARKIREEGFKLQENARKIREDTRKIHEETRKIREESLKTVEEIILKLLHTDMSIEKISKITGFSKEKIFSIQEKSK